MLFEEMEPGSYERGEIKAVRAFELYKNGEITQALSELEEALEINPSNSSWHFNKGVALDAVNRFEEAVQEYEIALELNPLDAEMLNSLGVDYTRTGHYDLAISVFERAQKLDTTFEPCYCNRIITYTEMGQHDLAEQMFYLAQQIDPDCALCYYNMGNSLFVRGEYKKAIGCWLRTAELEPAHPQINFRIAQAYWSDGNLDQARKYFLIELRRNPGEIDAILDFGLFLLETGDIESAKEKFNRILELKEDFAPALFYLGEIAFNNGDYESASKLFEQALANDSGKPPLTGARYRLAHCAIISGQSEKARAYLITELDMVPEDANVLVSMGSMFLAIEDFDYAAHCLTRALEVDCANADAYYYLGVTKAMRARLTEAAEFFGHALDINPEHFYALRDSAMTCLALGRLSDAAGRIARARALAGSERYLKSLSRAIRLAGLTEKVSKFFHCFRP
jgi:tetratricopeptide (TPR) repeat protein